MTRLLQSALAVMAMAAILLAGPIGFGGVAAAAAGVQESQLEREVDRLSAKERTQLERELSGRLAEAGIDLGDRAVQARLADALGVPIAEIERAAEKSNASLGAGGDSTTVLLFFVAVALIFAPSVFQSIGGSIFEWFSKGGKIDGVIPF